VQVVGLLLGTPPPAPTPPPPWPALPLAPAPPLPATHWPPETEPTGFAQPEPPPPPEEPAAADQDPAEPEKEPVSEAQQKIDELVAEGRLSAEQADVARQALDDADDGPEIRIGNIDGEGGLNFRIDPETGECTFDPEGINDMPVWLQKRLTPERLKEMCERIAADEGKTLGALLLDNIPVALIVLLPFMALVLKGLYPLSRRYFVEHLLFFVHFHAFFFLILTLQVLFSRLGTMIFLPEPIVILTLVAASLYIPVYLYKAMRRVYGQGHLLTATKYVVLVVTYFFGAMFTMMGALLVALFSV